MIKYKYRASLLFVFMSVLFTPTVGQADIVSVKDIRIEKISTKVFLQTTKTEQNHIKVANVCFITDSNDCRDDLFSKDDLGEEPGGSNPPPSSSDGDDEKSPCEEAGFHKTFCPDGWTAVDFCPYDDNYFKSCECHACDGYEYTADEIPAGYQAGASCDICGETLYKIVPSDCKGYSSCEHGPAEGALSCISGDETKYSNCCTPLPNESDCQYGTEEASDGCNGTRTICSACKPLPDEEGCENKHSCSDGCSGVRMCCDVDPCAMFRWLLWG